MSVFSDDFIEGVITPETETTNPTETMTIYREFRGMEAVAKFDDECGKPVPASEENGGDE